MPNTSATDTSKLMEVENSTDALSSSDTLSRSQCSSTTVEACRIITPLGRPVEPEVKITCDRFSGSTPLSGAASGSASISARAASSASVRAPCGSTPASAVEVRTSDTRASSCMYPRRSRG